MSRVPQIRSLSSVVNLTYEDGSCDQLATHLVFLFTFVFRLLFPLL